ncbi:Release factor glutamine methyltransferase [termite gut metagenome]|uniref:peptide chain release factor N(5)-glutamine methyltransferase n=1 Tax=termite gut metagenome TaxID=433724 RepID=A0A5J4RE78_9ZZZZ
MNRITSYIRQSLELIYSPQEIKSLILIICRDILRLTITDIYLNRDIDLSGEKWKELEHIVERLQKQEPIQYIRGYADFFGMSFHVASGVLIPRPETEELVEMIVKENQGTVRILDIGTGSGCIAISLAKHLPQATITAWDISEEALTIARENNNRLGTTVLFYKRNVLNISSCEEAYDLIVSNPPYITQAEKAEIEVRVTNWEPDIALFVPNEDPLRFYRHIALLGRKLLSHKGKLYFEINQAYSEETAEALRKWGYGNVRITKDLLGKDRFITAKR